MKENTNKTLILIDSIHQLICGIGIAGIRLQVLTKVNVWILGQSIHTMRCSFFFSFVCVQFLIWTGSFIDFNNKFMSTFCCSINRVVVSIGDGIITNIEQKKTMQFLCVQFIMPTEKYFVSHCISKWLCVCEWIRFLCSTKVQ